MAILTHITGLTLLEWAYLLSVAGATGLFTLIIYRLYLDPLARFPGPRLAALTGWYEMYFDCIKAGRYWVEIEKMHKQYGPIVRISPSELHVDDPDWNEPYKVTNRVNKYHWYQKFVGSSDSAFGTSDHDLHRIRRKAQQNYFTLDAVSKFDPKLESITSTLMTRLKGFKGTGEPANLSNAFRSFATDVVTEFSFHKSYNLLLQPDFAAAFHTTIRDFSGLGLWHRHLGIVFPIMDLFPRWLTELMNPAGIPVLDFMEDIGVQTKAIVDDYDKRGMNGNAKGTGRVNVVHQMLSSEEMSAKDKATERLGLEVRTLVAAGTETTGNTLSSIVFYMLSQPEKAQRLREEIRRARSTASSPLRYQDLVQLPYLSAVITEGLRISSSVSGRLPRLAPTTTLLYKQTPIPPGTAISTTQKLTHDNARIFPSPRAFVPERWLVAPEERRRLERYLQPFGRGSRSCLGIHLASSGLYVVIAELFSAGWGEMELFDTEESDILQYHDFFSPWPLGDRGVRVLIK